LKVTVGVFFLGGGLFRSLELVGIGCLNRSTDLKENLVKGFGLELKGEGREATPKK